MVPLPPHWDAIFGPLRGDAPDELFVVGQIRSIARWVRGNGQRPFTLH